MGKKEHWERRSNGKEGAMGKKEQRERRSYGKEGAMGKKEQWEWRSNGKEGWRSNGKEGAMGKIGCAEGLHVGKRKRGKEGSERMHRAYQIQLI
jgi:hypothetical protein